jgi:LAO/AO transport system kinase
VDPLQLLTRAVEGDRRSLARLLRVVEDQRPGWKSSLAEAWRRSGRAHLIGITGAPGSGKSTLTNALISAWRAVDRTVGVVAVDPSSPFTGGALLGDRIRMQDHVDDPDVFVRSMASRGRLGGLADATAGLTTLLDAAGFDPVVLETVGVGQSEVDIVHHADTVVILVTPGWGDAVQADKAGILEIGDVFVVNKADRPDTGETRRWLTAMLEMGEPGEWTPPVIETVATEDRGIEALVDAIDRHRRHLTLGSAGAQRRRRRARVYLEWALTARLEQQLDRPEMGGVIDEVVARKLDPWTAAEQLLDR